jgi:hypothetical protein
MSFGLIASWRAARPLAVATALTWLAASSAFEPAASAGFFQHLAGSWRGEGTLEWFDGTSEGLRCNAENEATDGGNKLNLVLKCASPNLAAPLNIVTDITYRAAAAVFTGTWQETSLLRWSGRISGSAKGNRIDARVSITTIQNISVRMSVTASGGQQVVILSATSPEGLTEVTVRMRKT